jgi:hypothetical protein
VGFEQVEHAMRHRDAKGITAVRSARKGFPRWRERRHDVGAPAEGRDRQAAAHNLPKRGQIGCDAGSSLRAF